MSATKILAQCVFDAATLHEKSFDMAACNRAKAAQQKKYSHLDPDVQRPLGFGLIDFSRFYRLTHLEAAEQACKDHPELVMPVHLLLIQSHNDALDWAVEILGITFELPA